MYLMCTGSYTVVYSIALSISFVHLSIVEESDSLGLKFRVRDHRVQHLCCGISMLCLSVESVLGGLCLKG